MNEELEGLKREQNAKLRDIGKVLNLDFSLEKLMKERGDPNSYEMQAVKRHREMIEKAETLMKKNKELEIRLRSLTSELGIITKERETLQESYSQQLIIMNKKLEDMKEEKEQKLCILEHQTKGTLKLLIFSPNGT